MTSVSFRLKHKETAFDVIGEAEEILWNVKERVAAEIGIDGAFQKWIYKGRVLTNEQTVGDAGIANEDTIIVMKAATASSPASVTSSGGGTSTVASPAAAAAAAPPAPPMVATPQFNMAMHTLLSNDEGIARTAVELLLKVVSNIVSNPMEEKYRRMRSSNATFRAKLGNVNGGNQCMQALGFDLNGETGDFTLLPTAEKWNNIVACQVKLQAFNDRMTSAGTTGASVSSSSSSSSAVSGGVATVATSAAAMAPVAAETAPMPVEPGVKVTEADTQQQVLLMAMHAMMMNKDKDAAKNEEGQGGQGDPGSGPKDDDAGKEA